MENFDKYRKLLANGLFLSHIQFGMMNFTKSLLAIPSTTVTIIAHSLKLRKIFFLNCFSKPFNRMTSGILASSFNVVNRQKLYMGFFTASTNRTINLKKLSFQISSENFIIFSTFRGILFKPFLLRSLNFVSICLSPNFHISSLILSPTLISSIIQ